MSNKIGVVTDELMMTYRISTWRKADKDRNLSDEDDYSKMIKLYKEELSKCSAKKIKDCRVEISNISNEKEEKEAGKGKGKSKGSGKKASSSKVCAL